MYYLKNTKDIFDGVNKKRKFRDPTLIFSQKFSLSPNTVG